MLLEGKRILVTGVLNDESIAFSVARVAQEQGAEVVLTSFGRVMSLTERAARRLPDGSAARRARRHQRRRPRRRSPTRVGGKLDGVVHAIGFAPESCLGGGFLDAPWEDVAVALQVSAYSLKALAVAALPLMERGRLDRRARLRQHEGVAGLRLDGRGEVGVRVDRPLPRPRPRAARASGSTSSPPGRCGRIAAKSIPGFELFEEPCGPTRAARLGPQGPRAGRQGRASRCCPTSSRPRPARSSTSTAASTPSAPEPTRREERLRWECTTCGALRRRRPQGFDRVVSRAGSRPLRAPGLRPQRLWKVLWTAGCSG